MASFAEIDLDVVRGNTASFPFQFLASTGPDVAVDLTGSTLRFVARTPNGNLTAVDLTITNATQGSASLALTAAQTRSFPNGSVTEYEIERRVGGNQTTLIMGRINAVGGINDD